jgi:hypothetical protein
MMSANRSRKTSAGKPKQKRKPAKATAETVGADRPAKAAKSAKPIAERVEVPGVSPASMKLVERALESYFLYRSSRKIGTARVEGKGAWTARFEDDDGEWTATAGSGPELLRLVGTFLLTKDAKAKAQRPVEEANPDLAVKGKKSAEERLSIAFAERAQKARIADLDKALNEFKTRVKPA